MAFGQAFFCLKNGAVQGESGSGYPQLRSGTGIIAKDDRLGPMERLFCCYCLQRKIVNCHPLENRPAM
jgi:hypothetical protein